MRHVHPDSQRLLFLPSVSPDTLSWSGEALRKALKPRSVMVARDLSEAATIMASERVVSLIMQVPYGTEAHAVRTVLGALRSASPHQALPCILLVTPSGHVAEEERGYPSFANEEDVIVLHGEQCSPPTLEVAVRWALDRTNWTREVDTLQRKVAVLDALQTDNEAHLAALWTHSPDAVALATIDQGTIVDVNPAFRQLLGLTRAQNVTSGRLRLNDLFSDPFISQLYDRLSSSITMQGADTTVSSPTSPHEMPVRVRATLVEVHDQSHILLFLRDAQTSQTLARAMNIWRDRFALLADQSKLAIAVLTPEGVVQWCSQTFEHRVGLTAATIYGELLLDLLPDFPAASALRNYFLLRGQDDVPRVPLHIHLTDWSAVINLFPVGRGPSVLEAGWLVYVEAQTPDLHATSVSSSDAPGRLDHPLQAYWGWVPVMEQLGLAVALLDANERLIYANGPLKDLLPDIPLGRPGSFLDAWVHPDDRSTLRQHIEPGVLNAKPEAKVPIRLLHPERGWVTTEARLLLIKTPSVPAAYVLVATPGAVVSADHEKNKRTEAWEDAQEWLNHEVRTPLTGILGFAAIMSEEGTTPEHLEFSHYIRSQGKRLLGTLDAVVDWALLRAGMLNTSTERVDVVHHVHVVTGQLQRTAGATQRLRLTTSAPHVYAEADTRLLNRVLHHLLIHLMQHVDTGSEVQHVRIQISKTTQDVVLRFELGSDADQPHLKLLNTSAATSLESVGLNLVRDLVAGLGGVFRCAGDLTGMELVLPRPPGLIERSTSVKLSDTEPRQASKVLFVGPDVSTAQLVRRVLTQVVNTDHAPSRRVADELMENRAYDIIFVDADTLSGVADVQATLLQVQEHPAYRNASVIALVPPDDSHQRAYWRSLGFDQCLHQPRRKAEMVHLLEQVRSRLLHKRQPVSEPYEA